MSDCGLRATSRTGQMVELGFNLGLVCDSANAPLGDSWLVSWLWLASFTGQNISSILQRNMSQKDTEYKKRVTLISKEAGLSESCNKQGLNALR